MCTAFAWLIFAVYVERLQLRTSDSATLHPPAAVLLFNCVFTASL